MTPPATDTDEGTVDETPAREPVGGATPTDAVVGTTRRRSVVLPWLVAVLTTAALVYVTLQWLPLRAQESERVAVATAAREVVTRLTTWDAAEGLDDTIAGLAEVGTGGFADEVEPFFSGPAGEALVSTGAASTAVVQDLFVQAIDGDDATVFVAVDQSVSTRSPEGRNVVARRAVVELTKQDGRWLASDVTVTDGIAQTSDGGTAP